MAIGQIDVLDDAPKWRPLRLQQIKGFFDGADFPWWIAGGYAIEHFVGRSLREHGDIDVLLLRKDSALVRQWLGNWDCWMVQPRGVLRRWCMKEELPESVSDIWCREHPSGPWQVQLMLDEGNDRDWRSRRCPVVTLPLADLGYATQGGLRFLTPEVQLFYKAKAPREKDEIDLLAALPLLDQRQKRWLHQAILTAYGPGNTWIDRVAA